MAQDQTDEDSQDEIQEIESPAELGSLEVTGIRGSLMRSMDRKRDTTGVVDAITAEDMGKFPDQNLAEALQRITGVSIDRFNNEGSRITVRGMGPEFNLVTFNGRSMPTAGGRSFDFNDIAADNISAVEIIKTGRANLPTGGIGATVNIETARPLDTPGMQASFSARAVHETSSSDGDQFDLDEITPEVAGLFSQTFADDTFGILLSASYQDRNNREENADVAFWTPNQQLNGGNVNNNNQRADGTWWHPQNVGYGFTDIKRERTNANLVLQWAPNDRFTATLDYLYSELELENRGTSFGIWFECPNIDATVNARGTVTEVTQSCGDFAVNVNGANTVKENDALGLNLEWQATDNLSFTFDAHSSSSEIGGGDLFGENLTSLNLIVGNTSCDWCGFDPATTGPFTATIDRQTAFFPAGGIPTFDVTFRSTGPDGGPQAGLLPSDIGSLFGQAFNSETVNDIDQFQLGGSWANEGTGALARIDFGYQFAQQEFSTRSAESGLLPAGFWLTSANYWPDDVWQLRSFDGLLDGFSNGGSFPYSDYYTADLATIIDFYETIGAGDPIFNDVYWPSWGTADFSNLTPEEAVDGNRGRFWSGALGNTGAALVQEDIHSFYTQAVFSDFFNGMPFNAVVGVRYEDTSTTSFGQEIPATAIIWVGGNEFAYEFAPNPSLREGSGDNSFWLPSIDMDLEVVDDVIVRASYSRTIARPPIGALGPNRQFVGRPNLRNRQVSTGNPDLLPYVSDNFDLSLEWYYDTGSYASLGLFRKRVDNFLVTNTDQGVTFEGLLDPYIGAAAEQARAELEAEGIQADDQAVFARINENRGVDPTTPVRAEPGDPLAEFFVNFTDNEEVGTLYGLEVAVQHMFGDTGWGIQANATIVDGDVGVDRDVVDRQFALPGLSDSANLSVFFENEAISARLAYNWRDEFLSGFDSFGSPVFTEEYAPLDLNVTWYVNNELSVFFEGLNITEEVVRSYIRYPEQFNRGNQYGARFNIGARYRF